MKYKKGNVKGPEYYILILEYHLIAKQYFMYSNNPNTDT